MCDHVLCDARFFVFLRVIYHLGRAMIVVGCLHQEQSKQLRQLQCNHRSQWGILVAGWMLNNGCEHGVFVIRKSWFCFWGKIM
jgi:hypothetical protein